MSNQDKAAEQDNTGSLLVGLAVIRELTGTQQQSLDATIEAVRAALASTQQAEPKRTCETCRGTGRVLFSGDDESRVCPDCGGATRKQAEPAQAAAPQDAHTLEKLRWCVEMLRSTADRGRRELGDGYPEVLQVLAAIRTITTDTTPKAEPAQAAAPDLYARLAEAHDACLDDDHRACRVILTECMSLLAAQPKEPVQPAEAVAWLHQCRKKPELRELSFEKSRPDLASMGYVAKPLVHPAPAQAPLSDEQMSRLNPYAHSANHRSVWTAGFRAGERAAWSAKALDGMKRIGRFTEEAAPKSASPT